MTRSPACRLTSLALLSALAACGADSRELPSAVAPALVAPLLGADVDHFSDWSTPVNLGPLVNSAANEFNATLSPDGLSLYFGSNRPGGLGGNDIWVSHRACGDCPWEPATNLGPPINAGFNESTPEFSVDGHLLFFTSNRDGSDDIYVSWRARTDDDAGWQEPIKVGPDVNSSALESGPNYVPSAEEGTTSLYFNRGASVAAFDLYVATVMRDGSTLGPALPVAELNSTAIDARPTVRADGREILFWSNRSGGIGGPDVWMSTRRSVHDPWSPPANLGGPVNSTFGETTPSLSRDGRTLVFSSGRPGGLGGNDLWLSTRRPTGHDATP